MKLCIIIPVYNVSEYLKQCLDSITTQSFNDFEVICIDDCSTDNSLDILKEYAKKDSRIKIIKNEKNIGVGLSRNKGLNLASGEYIHFIDPDDWLEPDVYSKLMSILEHNKNLDILFSSYNWYDNETKDIKKIEYPNTNILNRVLNPWENPEAFDNWERMCWLKILRRDFLIQNNIKFKDYKSLSDVEWSAETYINAKSLYYTNTVAINYRTNRPGSLVKNAGRSIKTICQSFINNRQKYKNIPSELKYRMLGADYYLLTTGVPNAYLNKIINIFELHNIIKEINNDTELNKYIFNSRTDFSDSNCYNIPILLNFWKVILKCHFPKMFYFVVKIRKKLRKK